MVPPLSNTTCFRLVGFGCIKICIDKIDNPFWHDLSKHFIKLSGANRDHDLKADDILDEPILYNCNIKMGNKTIYLKEWETLSILKIRDLLMTLVNVWIITFLMISMLHLTPILRYTPGIITAMRLYIDKVKQNPIRYKNSICNEVWACIRAVNKCVKLKFLEDKLLPTSTVKWNLQFEGLNLKTIFSNCFKFSTDPQLQWVQARLLHRIHHLKKNCKLFTTIRLTCMIPL